MEILKNTEMEKTDAMLRNYAELFTSGAVTEINHEFAKGFVRACFGTTGKIGGNEELARKIIKKRFWGISDEEIDLLRSEN